MSRGHSHSHSAAEELQFPDRTRRLLVIAAGALAGITVLLMAVFWPGDRPEQVEAVGLSGEFFDATIIALEEFPCPGEDQTRGLRCAVAAFRLLEGPDEGEIVEQDLFDLDAGTPIDEGDKVVMRYDEDAAPGFEYQYTGDRQRKPVLFWLAVLFAVSVVALGRLRGLAALGGLAASLLVLGFFVLPAIIEGQAPLLVAVIGSSAIAFLSLYLAHGFNSMTTVALFGTLAALFITGVLGIVFVDLAAFSGLASEDAFFLQVSGGDIDLRGLILAGVVIGALGAIDDMTVTQASAVWELHAANPSYGTGRLFRSAMEIGRDHVASTVNTLVLAYAGASMPLLILFVLGEQALTNVANTEVVATEIVRTLVGSIGLVAAVPITTWLAALIAPNAAPRRGRRVEVETDDPETDPHPEG